MIEQVMVFALGFLIAGLMALAFAPVFWARAVRLSVRRLEMQLPLSMREILADRDLVRAESAIAQRRVEQKAEALNLAHVEDLAELGRRAARLQQLQEHIGTLRQTNASLSLDLKALNRAHAELSAEASALVKELYDLDSIRNREKNRLQNLTAEHQSLMSLSEEQKAHIATVSACQSALEVRLADTERALASTQTLLCNKEAEATLLASHLERARDEIQASDAARRSAIEKYERQGVRVADLENQLKDSQTAEAESLAKLRAMGGKLDAHEVALADAATRDSELKVRHDAVVERMRSTERGLIDRIDRLRAENAALQGALGAARQECSTLTRDLSAARLHNGQKAPAEPPLKAESA